MSARKGRPRIVLPVDDIIDLYVREKLPMRVIAARYGVALTTIRDRLMVAHGRSVVRPRGGLTREARQRAAERTANQ